MDQARYWMWTNKRRPHSMSSNIQASSTNPPYDDSWEEQAFAEDAAGPLGGCIWPPRSYSCSFCRREFRSAQALGGHMNVHRRDRARLKQSPSPHKEILHGHELHQNNHNHLENHYASLGFQYPPQICTLVYSPNPNSVPLTTTIPSPTSSSRVSTSPTTRGNCCEKTFFPSFSSHEVEEHHKNPPIPSLPLPNSAPGRYHHIPDPKNEGDKSSRIVEPGCRAKVNYVKNDLSVSLNLVVRRTRPAISDGDGEEEEEEVGCKRRRTVSPSSLPFFVKPTSVDAHHHVQPEVFEIGPCAIEELDLELRLGDRPPKAHKPVAVLLHSSHHRGRRGPPKLCQFSHLDAEISSTAGNNSERESPGETSTPAYFSDPREPHLTAARHRSISDLRHLLVRPHSGGHRSSIGTTSSQSPVLIHPGIGRSAVVAMEGVIKKFFTASMFMWMIPVAILYAFQHNLLPGVNHLSSHTLTLLSGLLAVISVNIVIAFYIYLAMKEPTDKHEPDAAFLAEAKASVNQLSSKVESSSESLKKEE
ncbi:hypothetical protein Tsubulata_002795 [Turnera subulata]|uniref:Vacuolar ATPase assembly integral membrane protein VMA21 homolog n=1 Tax=Turnera subulata TaxID=218843 RepID=A0A9Q0FPD7_9ROSI|nr:hypothetical protein Tsubulata_002795 [Turnera subulata]